MRRALCVGINEYPTSANDLNGCVNDAEDWGGLLKSYGFTVDFLLNKQATRLNIISGLFGLVIYANDGDDIVFTYSGHGTQTVDMSGDEEDGYDEALFVYNGMIVDDDIRKVLEALDPGVNFTIISDSCFSGTVTRKIRGGEGRVRFVRNPRVLPNAKLKKKLVPEEEMRVMLLSGCNDDEYSYDAFIAGRYNGAFSRWAINAFAPGLLYSEWYALIRETLPSPAYPQTPQLEGAKKHTPVFGLEEPETPEPIPEPTPGPERSTWWHWPLVGAIVVIGLIAMIRFTNC